MDEAVLMGGLVRFLAIPIPSPRPRAARTAAGGASISSSAAGRCRCLSWLTGAEPPGSFAWALHLKATRPPRRY